MSGLKKPMAPGTVFERTAVEDFLIEEADMLDERRFEEWRDLFDEDGYYWVPLSPDQKSPEDEVSLFYDDRDAMEVRFTRLRHPRIHSQLPHTRTCRIVGNVRIQGTEDDGQSCIVVSKLNVTDFRQGLQRVFAGRVLHKLRPAGDSFKIAWKKVDLINCDDTFDIIAIPF